MVELVISVIDRAAAEPAVDAAMPKRGVVIDVFEDGHDYGRMELTHPMFRILKLPGTSLAFGQSFLGSEPGEHPLALRRQMKIDIDHPDVPADLRAHLADDSRTTPHIVVDPSLITTLKRKRPPLADLTVIGAPATIIG